MTGDLVNEVLVAGPEASGVAGLAILLILAGLARTVHCRPWASVGVLAAGVAVLAGVAVWS